MDIIRNSDAVIHGGDIISQDPQTGEERIPWDWIPSHWTEQPELYNKDGWHKSGIMKTGKVPEEYECVCNGIDEILEEYGYIRNKRFTP